MCRVAKGLSSVLPMFFGWQPAEAPCRSLCINQSLTVRSAYPCPTLNQLYYLGASSLQFLDFTASTPQENLALDEAMLMLAEGSQFGECLRVWDALSPFVVLGRGSRYGEEVQLDLCRQDSVPVLRRVSGGATILAAPGCMFYTVLLSLERRPELQMLDNAHSFVMQEIQRAIEPLRHGTELQGTCDLTLSDRKVSGNALRVTREWVLYHGTLLVNMDLQLVSRYLRHPPREPDYRGKRSHADFIANLEIDRQALCASLQKTWGATDPVTHSERESLDSATNELVTGKYALDSWNLSR